MRVKQGCGVPHCGLRDAGHVLERGDPGARGRERIDLPEMGRDREPQHRRLVHQGAQQLRRDLRVDLDPVGAGDGTLIDRLTRLRAASHGRGVGVRGRRAVDHRPRRKHPGPEHRAQVEVILEHERRIVVRVQVAHGRDAPRDVAQSRPPLDVRVRVDQARDDRLADETDALGPPRYLNLVHARHGFDMTVLDEQQCVLDQVPARAVDQRGTLECDHPPARRLAARAEEKNRGGQKPALRAAPTARPPDRLTARHGFRSEDVWSWMICHRSPRF